MNEILIYNGSFDPIHKGHVEIINYFSRDSIYVCPNNINKGKINRLKLEIRLKMLYDIYKEEINVRIIDEEVDKFIDKNRNKKIIVIIGSDVFNERIIKNKEPKIYADKWYVIKREGDEIIRAPNFFGKEYMILTDIKNQHISSTNIRNCIKKCLFQDDKSLWRDDLHPTTYDYILKNNLYIIDGESVIKKNNIGLSKTVVLYNNYYYKIYNNIHIDIYDKEINGYKLLNSLYINNLKPVKIISTYSDIFNSIIKLQKSPGVTFDIYPFPYYFSYFIGKSLATLHLLNYIHGDANLGNFSLFTTQSNTFSQSNLIIPSDTIHYVIYTWDLSKIQLCTDTEREYIQFISSIKWFSDRSLIPTNHISDYIYGFIHGYSSIKPHIDLDKCRAFSTKYNLNYDLYKPLFNDKC